MNFPTVILSWWISVRWISHRSRCDYPRSEYAKQIREQRAAPHCTSQGMPTTLWYSGFTAGFKTSIKPRPFTVWRELHFYISGGTVEPTAYSFHWAFDHNFTPPDPQVKSFTPQNCVICKIFLSLFKSLNPSNISHSCAHFLGTNELIRKFQQSAPHHGS